jgi:hypothetical protein
MGVRPTDRGRPAGAWVAALVAVAVLGLGLPVALARVPPILDYPNHLARMWLLAGAVDQAPMSHIYAVDWSLARTNIAIDFVAATVGRAIPVFTLGRLLVLLALAAPPLGAIALHRSLYGRAHWWQAAFPLLAFSQTLLAGFLNFQIGLGLALAAAAAEPWLKRRGWLAASLARAGFGAALYGAHAFALGFYVVLLAALAAGPNLPDQGRRRWALRAARDSLAAAAAACAPAGLLALAAPKAAPGVREIIWQATIDGRAKAFLAPLTTYDLRVDAAFAVVLALPVLLAFRRGKLHFGLFEAAVALAVLGLAAPISVAGTWWIAPRFPVMAALALVCAVEPDLPRAWAAKAAATLALCALAKSAWVGEVWRERQADIRAVERSLAAVPAGAAVLVAQNTADRRAAPLGRYTITGPAYWHFPALATPERRAFIPYLFTAAGKQPLRVLPPWTEISVPEGIPPSVDLLAPPPPGRAASLAHPPAYLQAWGERFDYLLVINADLPSADGPMPRLANLALISDQGFAQLYRIARPAAP